MSKLIIKNESGADDMTALWLTLQVVKGGRVSSSSHGPQYCWVSLTKKHEVLATRTKSGTDVFRIRNRING